MEVKFNINDIVKVKLNDNSKDILKERYKKLRTVVNNNDGILDDHKPRKEDENGYVKFQLWELLDIFGDRVYLSGQLPFESEIKLKC